MLAISCAIDNNHVQMHAPCLWPADCWRVTEEQPGTQQPGSSCTGGLFQRPLQPPHGLQRRAASRSCAGLSSALQSPSNVRPGCCRCITPVTLLSVVECKHVAAPHAGRCPLRGWPAAKRPIFCRKSAGEGRVQNSGHAGRRIEPGQAPLAAARRRRYRPRRSHVLRLEHVQVFFDANPASMMPGSVSPSPLPGPHAAADANASLRMHEVW